MRNLGILPPVYASNSCPLSSLTLNWVLGSASTTVPSISMASFLGTTNLSSGAAAGYRLSETASRCGARGAALCLETVGAIDGFIAPRLEGNARLAITASAGSHEQLAPGCSAIAASVGIAGWRE